MAAQKISAKVSESSTVTVNGEKQANPHAGQSVSCVYNFGGDLEGLVKLISSNGRAPEQAEAVVYANAVATMVSSAQSLLRRGLNSGKDSGKIQEDLSGWIPGDVASRSKLTIGQKAVKVVGDTPTTADYDEAIAALEAQKETLEA